MKRLFSSFFFCLLLASASCQAQDKGVQQLSATEFNGKLEAGADYQLLDVRTPAEYREGHLNHAVNIDIHDPAFKDRLAALDKYKPIYVYCLGGGRSAAAAATLHEQGFRQVFDMKGGIMAWKNNNLAVVGGKANTAADKFKAADLDKILGEHEVVLIDFYAEWCIPCRKMEPMLNRLTKEYEDSALIYRLNIEEAKALTAALKIEGIPVFQVYKRGKLLKAIKREQDEKAIRALITEAL